MASLGWFALPFPVDGVAWRFTTGDLPDRRSVGARQSRCGDAYVGTFIPGLVIYRHGTDDQRDRFKPGLLDGAYRIAVAISEPDAAPMSPRCVARPSTRRSLRGQRPKSVVHRRGLPGALIATYVRTDPDAPKHRGISLLLIPNDSPGIEIRRTPTLARHLLGTNEVYFDNVQVPKGNLIGP